MWFPHEAQLQLGHHGITFYWWYMRQSCTMGKYAYKIDTKEVEYTVVLATQKSGKKNSSNFIDSYLLPPYQKLKSLVFGGFL